MMGSEDFSFFALSDPKPPICMFWLGAVRSGKNKRCRGKGDATAKFAFQRICAASGARDSRRG